MLEGRRRNIEEGWVEGFVSSTIADHDTSICTEHFAASTVCFIKKKICGDMGFLYHSCHDLNRSNAKMMKQKKKFVS